MPIARSRSRPQPPSAAEVLADTHADPCGHGGLPGRCPMCRATVQEPPEPAVPRRRGRRKPKLPPPPPFQLTLADAMPSQLDHQETGR